MPAILATIAVWLAQITGPLVARVLGALGIGIFTLAGVQAGVQALISSVKSALGGVAADILSIMTIAGFDVYISLVISAYVGIITLRTVFGAFRRFGFAAQQGVDG